MTYAVMRTDTASQQITEAVRYLAEVSDSTSPALRLLDAIDDAATRLATFPKIGAVPSWGTLARRGYRKLDVGSYLLLYKVDDAAKTVTIHAFVHARQQYWKLV